MVKVYMNLYMHFIRKINFSNCHSAGEKRLHDQGNLSRKVFNQGLAYSFRRLGHDHHCRKHQEEKQAVMLLEQRAYILPVR